MLARAGVRLIDAPGAGLFELLQDGDRVRIDGGTVLIGDREVLRGQRARRGRAGAASSTSSASGSTRRSHEFAENTVAHVREETDLLTGTVEFPRHGRRFATATS